MLQSEVVSLEQRAKGQKRGGEAPPVRPRSLHSLKLSHERNRVYKNLFQAVPATHRRCRITLAEKATLRARGGDKGIQNRVRAQLQVVR